MAGVISASQKNSAVPSTPTAMARLAHGLVCPTLLLDQRHQRQDAAFARVVRAQQQQHVLQRNEDQQAPEDERQDAEDLGRLARATTCGMQGYLERIQRAGADVAVDDAERADDLRRQTRVVTQSVACRRLIRAVRGAVNGDGAAGDCTLPFACRAGLRPCSRGPDAGGSLEPTLLKACMAIGPAARFSRGDTPRARASD